VILGYDPRLEVHEFRFVLANQYLEIHRQKHHPSREQLLAAMPCEQIAGKGRVRWDETCPAALMSFGLAASARRRCV
jgi:hypothetical protein